MAQKRFDDVDDDERPRRSRRDDDYDDDYDDRTRRRKRKSKTPMWVWIAIPIGLFVVCAGCFGMMLPAVQKVRSAALRSKQMGNMTGIGLGMHELHNENGFLPVPFALDENKQPNPGLSWRVGVLPFIEQNGVYAQFDRSKSWNSPRNQLASNKKISAYMSPDEMNAVSVDTRMFGFNGPGALMEANLKLKMNFVRVTDGTSNTAMVADVTTGAPWASPTDVPYVRNGPLPSFGVAGNDSFLLLLADGSVRNMKKNISPAVMHALIQIDDGLVIDFDGL